jgi:tetratricopeptide (TPR) repeat protein
MTNGGGIRHEPFFAILGKMSEDNERWPAFLAALVTLRLIDEWLLTRHAPEEMVTAVQTTIATIPATNPSRQLVGDLLAPIAAANAPDIHAVAKPLFAYARWLQNKKYWAVADDVYTMVWRGLMNGSNISSDDLDLASEAALYAGACRRNASDNNAADAAYKAARAIATELGNDERVGLAELGQAKVKQRRGDLPAAEAAIRALIARTKHNRALKKVYAHACHDLGVTLFNREEFGEAFTNYREALLHTDDRTERLRVLIDVGSVLGEINCVTEARIANAAVLRDSDDPELQGMAGINLMELARIEADRPAFQHFRGIVEQRLDTLGAKVQVDFHYTLGLGCETFQDPRRARDEYDLAIKLAEDHGLGQELYKVDCARDALADGLSNVVEPLPRPTVDSLEDLRKALEFVTTH